MKWLVAISLIVFLLIVGFVTAESTILKMTCPVCHKPITDGSFTAQKLIKGKPEPVHFACAYEDMMRFKWEQVKQERDK